MAGRYEDNPSRDGVKIGAEGRGERAEQEDAEPFHLGAPIAPSLRERTPRSMLSTNACFLTAGPPWQLRKRFSDRHNCSRHNAVFTTSQPSAKPPLVSDPCVISSSRACRPRSRTLLCCSGTSQCLVIPSYRPQPAAASQCRPLGGWRSTDAASGALGADQRCTRRRCTSVAFGVPSCNIKEVCIR